MTAAQVAKLLIEELPKQLRAVGADPKISALANRVALLINSVPSLQSFWADFAIYQGPDPDTSSSDKAADMRVADPDAPTSDKRIRMQFDFMRLPKEIIPEVEKLLSAHQFTDFSWKQYIKNGSARVGLQITVDPENLPGDAYDYAF